MTESAHVLITGANGQVGRELQRASWPTGWRVTGLSSSDLDITNRAAVDRIIDELEPSIVVNAAAYTAVDAAETDEERATAVNSAGVANLADAINRHDGLLIHVSTDYVFDGTKTGRYLETDPVAPVGAYGRSKAAGEIAAALAHHSVTLRTAWVYGALGSNFVTTMLRLAQEREQIGVVDDQVGCPTAAADIAATSVAVATTWLANRTLPSALYHVASPDAGSWFEVAREVFDSSNHGFGGELRALSTEEYPTAAVRPANSTLDTSRLKNELGIELPPWRDSLRAVVQELETTT